MSQFVKAVNPFAGTLCMPYYYLWLLTLISWVLAWLQFAFCYLLDKCHLRIANKKEGVERKLVQQMLDGAELELQKLQIEGQLLLIEIIQIIMSMLPDDGKDYQQNRKFKEACDEKYRQITKQRKWATFSGVAYSLTRFVCNGINFVYICMHYAEWHRQNEQLSEWRKYCAFIVAMFYMPSMKCRGIMTVFGNGWTYFDEHRTVLYQDEPKWWSMMMSLDFFVDSVFIMWLIAIALPMSIPGLFIFIPNAFLLGFVLLILVGIVYGALDAWTGHEGLSVGATMAIVISVCSIWGFNIITLSTMEFYFQWNWVRSWETGFLANYCNDDDYFSFDKWSGYPSYIQFLIISWLIF